MIKPSQWGVAVVGFASLLLSSAPSAWAVHMWARRYGLSCSACHAYPSLQLTSMGLDFFRRGHRFEKDNFDKSPINYISAHGEWTYIVQQHESTAFQAPEFHLHAGGALDPHFSAYVDVNINEEFEVAYLQFTKEHGDNYFTVRAGKISPTIVRDYGNGIMASSSTPLIVTAAVLGQNPFTPARGSFGIDAAQRWKILFVQAGVINGEDIPGQVTVGNHKDVYATAEVNAGNQPTGVGVYYHHGAYQLGDPSIGLAPDSYDRQGVFANFTRDHVRLAAAYLFGKDRIVGAPDQKIHGFYVQGDLHPAGWCAPFARYDWVKTEDGLGGEDRVKLITVGSSFRLFENDITVARAVVEVSRRTDTSVNGALFNLIWAF